ncbi:hypothetical protein ACTVZO_38355 [Streptomyces sp. IBSNAI002]|uniref:hypothetical protein n=1 Tax=Streptomyces sp. IBSNAI002 TaxID=3457500 RepID=UPI003FCF3FC5
MEHNFDHLPDALGTESLEALARCTPEEREQLQGQTEPDGLSDALTEAFESYCRHTEGSGPNPFLFLQFKLLLGAAPTGFQDADLLSGTLQRALSACSAAALVGLPDMSLREAVSHPELAESFRAFCEVAVFRALSGTGLRLSGLRYARTSVGRMDVEIAKRFDDFDVDALFKDFKDSAEEYRTGHSQDHQRAEEHREAGLEAIRKAREARASQVPAGRSAGPDGVQAPSKRRSPSSSDGESSDEDRSGRDRSDEVGPDFCARLYSQENLRKLENRDKAAVRAAISADERLAGDFRGRLFNLARDHGLASAMTGLATPTIADFYDLTVTELYKRCKTSEAKKVFDTACKEFTTSFASQVAFQQHAAADRKQKREEAFERARSAVESRGGSASLHDRRLVLLRTRCDLPDDVLEPLASLPSEEIVLFREVVASESLRAMVHAAVRQGLHEQGSRVLGGALTAALAAGRRGPLPGGSPAEAVWADDCRRKLRSRREYKTLLDFLGRPSLTSIARSLDLKALSSRNRRNLPVALTGKSG